MTPSGPLSALTSRPHRARVVAALLVAAIAAVIGGGATAGVVLTRDAVYQSQALLIIDQPRVLAESRDAGVIVKLNSLRLKYAALTDTSAISGPVAERLEISEGQVRAQADAEATFDALVLRTVGKAGSPQGARLLAQAVAEELVDFVEQEQAGIPIPPAARIELRIVQDAFPGVQVEPDETRAAFVALAAAILSAAAGLGLTLALPRRQVGSSP